MRKNILNFAILMLLIPVIQACSAKNDTEVAKNTELTEQEAEKPSEVVDEKKMKEMIKQAESQGDTSREIKDAESVAASEKEEPAVKMFVEDRSPSFNGARARITWPESESVLEADDIFVIVEVNNIELGRMTANSRALEIANSASGQHVHLIIDNQPYNAIYEAGNPINIGKLSPGPHTIFAFPSRSYHESIKAEGAADLLNFYVTNSYSPFGAEKDKPAIFYSRPKGSYEGMDSAKIMLDFYLHNVELSQDGFNVRYTVTNKADSDEQYSIIITEWKPAFITGLDSGTYIVKLELIDSSGNIVENVAYNGTAREIKVVQE